jgi:hypothetical protein
MDIFSTKSNLELRWRMWEHYKDAYTAIISDKSLPQIPTSIDFKMNSFSGDLKYRKLKETGKLPQLFHIGEKIRENRNKTCIQPPVLDPVYRFLLDINKFIEKTASEIYDQQIAPSRLDEIESDIEKDYYLEGKCRSLRKMIEFFETRGRLPQVNNEDESLRINSEERYKYLSSFFVDNGLFSQKKLEEFIEFLPSNPFEQIHWPTKLT